MDNEWNLCCCCCFFRKRPAEVRKASRNVKHLQFYVGGVEAKRVTVCIVSNDFAKTNAPLKSAQIDVKNIKDAFDAFSAEVTFVEAKNMRAGEIIKTIRNIGCSFFRSIVSFFSGALNRIDDTNKCEKPNLFFLFITSHGNRDGLIGADDDTSYSTHEVYEAIQSNTFLKTSLKIFVFDSCRGDTVETLKETVINDEGQNYKINRDSTQLEPTSNINIVYPQNSITLHSSTEGSYSYQNDNSGSTLITQFCAAIKKPIDGTDILELITGVQEKICHHEVCGIANNLVQTPECVYMAQQTLHLRSTEKGPASRRAKKHIQDLDLDIKNHSGFCAAFKLKSWKQDTQATELCNVLEENLHISVVKNTIKADEGLAVVEEIISTVNLQYHNEAFILLLFFGKFVCSKIKTELCFEKDGIPIHAITKQLVGNSRLSEVPSKICIFIDPANAADARNDSKFPSDGMSSKALPPYSSRFVTKHSSCFNIICVGKQDLESLVLAFRNPDLYDISKNYHLLPAMAEWVRQCVSETKHFVKSHFISTAPLPLIFAKKHVKMIPQLQLNKNQFELVDSKGELNWTNLAKLFLNKNQKQLWFLTADVGMGKTFFLLQFRNYLRKMPGLGKDEFVDFTNYYSDPRTRTSTYPEAEKVESGGTPLQPPESVIFLFDNFDKLLKLNKMKARDLIKKCAEEGHSVMVASKFEQDQMHFISNETSAKMIPINVLTITGYDEVQLQNQTRSLTGKDSVSEFDKSLYARIKNDIKLLSCPQLRLILLDVLKNTNVSTAALFFTFYHKGFTRLSAKNGQNPENYDEIYNHHLIIAAKMANFDKEFSEKYKTTMTDIKKHSLGTNEKKKINDVGIIDCSNNNLNGNSEFRFVFESYKDFFVAVFLIVFFGDEKELVNEKVLDHFKKQACWSQTVDFMESFRFVSDEIRESYINKRYTF